LAYVLPQIARYGLKDCRRASKMIPMLSRAEYRDFFWNEWRIKDEREAEAPQKVDEWMD
jgi:hypothetical protein